MAPNWSGPRDSDMDTVFALLHLRSGINKIYVHSLKPFLLILALGFGALGRGGPGSIELSAATTWFTSCGCQVTMRARFGNHV